MADTELYVTKVRTKDGDKQIDYNALANLPEFDEDWKAAHGIADAGDVSDALSGMATKAELASKADVSALATKADIADLAAKADAADLAAKADASVVTNLDQRLTAHQSDVNTQFTAVQANLTKNYVTTTALTAILEGNPDTGDLGYASVDYADDNYAAKTHTHTLANIKDVHVCDSDPGTYTNDHWYLIKVEE